jgi:hypothetical protein
LQLQLQLQSQSQSQSQSHHCAPRRHYLSQRASEHAARSDASARALPLLLLASLARARRRALSFVPVQLVVLTRSRAYHPLLRRTLAFNPTT